MNMRYRDLLNKLQCLSKEELNQTATIFVPGVDEYYPVAVSFTDDDCDVLDPGHLVLTITSGEL